jgi:hypothetical protein
MVTAFMSVVFQFQPTEQSDQEFTRLRMTVGVIALEIRSQARENFYGAACRSKLKYHDLKSMVSQMT